MVRDWYLLEVKFVVFMVVLIATGLGTYSSTPLVGDLGGGVAANFRMWPDRVVVVFQGGQDRSGVGQQCNQRLNEAFFAQPAVERRY